jgi:NADH-quinone oxidoreductase subunit H
VIQPADIGFFEPWWIQIIKALVIFALAFAILPLLTVYERKFARSLPLPLLA